MSIKRLTVKVGLLLVVLVMVGLVSAGCVKGLQPIGWSGGAISDGTLFVGSKEGRLVAVNLTDEGRLWSEPLRAERKAGSFFGSCAPMYGGGCGGAASGVAIYGTPAIYGELVYIGGYNGKVYAFTAGTLVTRWVYPREEYLEPIVGGLLVAQDRVYFGDSEGKVFALDAATGDPLWEFETGEKVWMTPAVDGNTLFVGSFDSKLYALDAADGSLKWTFEAEGALSSPPLVDGGVVYVGSFDRHLYAINESDGSLKWKFMGENWFWAKPVVYDDTLYAGCLDDKVYALSPYSGEKVAEFNLGSPVASSPVVVDGSIIFASKEGVVYAIDTGSKALKQLADIGEDIYGPLCADGRIVYLHTQDLKLQRVNAVTGAILGTISLESKD